MIALNSTSQIVGSTRLFDIAQQHQRAEIGYTWISPSHQRTGVNTEAKLMLLTFAFEAMDCQKIVFKTESLNEQSQRAIERLGATKEGIFRKHLIADNGRVRDMIYYAIFHADWPKIKESLAGRLQRG